jgi:hypothetical protein
MAALANGNSCSVSTACPHLNTLSEKEEFWSQLKQKLVRCTVILLFFLIDLLLLSLFFFNRTKPGRRESLQCSECSATFESLWLCLEVLSLPLCIREFYFRMHALMFVCTRNKLMLCAGGLRSLRLRTHLQPARA